MRSYSQDRRVFLSQKTTPEKPLTRMNWVFLVDGPGAVCICILWEGLQTRSGGFETWAWHDSYPPVGGEIGEF